MPTANGAPIRFASAAISWCSTLPSKVSTSITFSGHTTRSVLPGSMLDVAARWRSTTSRGSVWMARVPCGPPPCTIVTRIVRPASAPSGATAASTITTTAARNAAPPCRCGLAPRRRTIAGTYGDGPASAKPIWNTNQVSRIDAAHPCDAEQWSAGLADGQGGERHPAEGDHQSQRLDEGVRRRSSDHPPRAGGCDQRRPVRGARRTCSPTTRYPGAVRNHIQPMPGNNHPAPNSEAAPRVDASCVDGVSPRRHLEQHHPDDRERPEAPRWQRESRRVAPAPRASADCREVVDVRGGSTDARALRRSTVADRAAIGGWSTASEASGARSRRRGDGQDRRRQTDGGGRDVVLASVSRSRCTTMRSRVEPGWVAREQRGGRLPGLIDDVHRIGLDDGGFAHPVHEGRRRR
jgi:hypothetical protein